MESTLLATEEGKVKLSVQLDSEEVEQTLAATYRKIAKQVRIKGFRPGKAPRKVIEAHLGQGFARRQALTDLLDDSYRKAVVHHDVDVISPPEINILTGEAAGPVSYEALVEVRPNVNVIGYEDIKVSVDAPVAQETEIDSEIDVLRAKFGELEEVRRPAVDGDHVKIDVYTTLNGEEVASLCVDDYHYEVGSAGVVPEIDENLRGASMGDICEFTAAHPDEAEEGNLRFRILLKGVNALRLPDLDDDFVRQASEFDSVEELQAEIRAQITSRKTSLGARRVETEILEALANLVLEEPPEILLKAEIERRLKQFEGFLEQQGKSFDDYLEETQSSREQAEEELRPAAVKAVKVDLALRAVAESETLEVSEDDLREEVNRMAAAAEMDAQELRNRLDASGGWLNVRADLRKHRAMQWLREHVELVDSEGDSLERSQFFPSLPSEQPQPQPQEAID